MRYKKIYKTIDEILNPIIWIIKRVKKRSNMPYKDIETILKILFPKTKNYPKAKGFYKRVFIIHAHKNKIALKIARNRKHIKKDWRTYEGLPKKIKNRYFAKIYWANDIFMLQKYGKKTKVPDRELEKLKSIGKKYGLTDVREANIMKFGNKYKIVDAERKGYGKK